MQQMNGHAPAETPNLEHALENLQTLCECLLQVIKLSEGKFNIIAEAAGANKGTVRPDGLVLPMREYVKLLAESGRDNMTQILGQFDREDH